MQLVTDVSKKSYDQIEYAAKEGCLLYGIYMEGGRWDTQAGAVED
eukprot:gene5143-9_t